MMHIRKISKYCKYWCNYNMQGFFSRQKYEIVKKSVDVIHFYTFNNYMYKDDRQQLFNDKNE